MEGEHYQMDINEISIYLKNKPNYICVLNEVIDYIIVTKKNLCFKTTIIDDWEFTNEQEVERLEEKYCEDKIYLIDIYNENKRIFNFKLYRDQQYVIDIYFDNYIKNQDIVILIQMLINVLKEYIFIAVGDDFLLNYDVDMKKMIKKSSGIEFWILPKGNEKGYHVIR